ACLRGDARAAHALAARDPALARSRRADDVESFCSAAESGREGAVRLMVEMGFDVAAESAGGGTALHRAAWFGRAAMGRLLVELGAPLDLRDKTYGSSPLGWAAHGSRFCRAADDDYVATVDALADAGARLEPTVNRWEVPPGRFASEKVAARL